MIRHLATSITLNDGDVFRIVDVDGAAALPLSKHRRMLQRPEFINRIVIPRVDELTHPRPARRVVYESEMLGPGRHSTINI